MTVKEAILESLEKLSRQSTYQEITDYIKSNELYITKGKTTFVPLFEKIIHSYETDVPAFKA